MYNILFLLVLLTTVSFSDTATQTDWSGGGGLPGPVFAWGNSYDVASQIDDSVGIQLGIVPASDPVENVVEDFIYMTRSVYAEDLDGDGDNDILIVASYDNDVIWWENVVYGVYWEQHTIDSNFEEAFCVYATDVDGDGDVDVLGAARTANDIAWWENNDGSGASWTKHLVDVNYGHAVAVFATDVDGDDDTDIIGAAQWETGYITWWENMDGSGTSWTLRHITIDFDTPSSVFATDVDGDGDNDVLGTAYQDGEITWWENTDGTGTSWTEHIIDDGYGMAQSVIATDIDGDGDTDVVGAAQWSPGYITWWENMDGSGTSWTLHHITIGFDTPTSVYAIDLDDDGDADVLGSAYMDDDVTWWENADGTGSSWTEHLVDGQFNSPFCVYASDLNADGYIDVLGSAPLKVSWWQITEFSSAGSLESSILDVSMAAVWESCSNNGYQPSGTSLGYQFRSSQDPGNMGAWSDTLYGTNIDLTGILTDSTEYIQYKTILQSTDPLNTPILGEITVSYSEYTGINDDHSALRVFWNLASAANPSGRDLTVRVSVQQQELVHLMMFDITGRLVARYSQELPGGMHSIYFNDLFPGIYLCTMHAGDFSTVQRIVVIE